MEDLRGPWTSSPSRSARRSRLPHGHRSLLAWGRETGSDTGPAAGSTASCKVVEEPPYKSVVRWLVRRLNRRLQVGTPYRGASGRSGWGERHDCEAGTYLRGGQRALKDYEAERGCQADFDMQKRRTEIPPKYAVATF